MANGSAISAATAGLEPRQRQYVEGPFICRALLNFWQLLDRMKGKRT